MKTEINYPQLEIPDGWVCIGYQTPKRGMGYITCNGPEFAITSCDFSECLTSVRLCFRKIEPVDAELESAKKLIGKWVIFKTRDVILKVKTIRIDKWSNKIVFQAEYFLNEPVDFYLEDFNPFPLPTWRCCATDKPKDKKEGERYFVRCKFDHRCKNVHKFTGQSFILENSLDFEWLDEGEL